MDPREPRRYQRPVWLVCLLAACLGAGAEPGDGALPPPRKTAGMPLMEALSQRHSSREIGTLELPVQMLSDLLWAACGVNRPEAGMRTAPSAVNWQEIDIFVASKDGVRLFDPPRHRLKPLLTRDIRAEIGLQPFVKQAPICLIYVADFAKMTRASEEDKVFYSACDVGFISQDVYLFAASEGLSTCVVGLVKRKPLAETLGLRPEQRVLLCQPVGYPAPPGAAGADQQ